MECLQYSVMLTRLELACKVLNLVISGMPSIQHMVEFCNNFINVLNLVISGMPSILSPDYAQSQNGALF